MSEHDAADDALERLEWSDERGGRGSRNLRLTRRTALTGTAAGIAAAMLDACGSAATSASASDAKAQAPKSAAGALYGVSAAYRFSFVSHARSNIFFTPTINGIQDACALLGGLIIAVVYDGLALMGVAVAVENIATAIVLIAAVALDAVVRRRSSTR